MKQHAQQTAQQAAQQSTQTPDWHCLESDDVLHQLESSATGLSYMQKQKNVWPIMVRIPFLKNVGVPC